MDSTSHAPRWPGSDPGRARVVIVAATQQAGAAAELAALVHQRKASAIVWSGGAPEKKLAFDVASRTALDSAEVDGGGEESPWGSFRSRFPGKTILAIADRRHFQSWLARALRSGNEMAGATVEPGKLAIVDVDAGGIALRGLNLDWSASSA